MSIEQLRKRLKELRERGLLGAGYTAPELPGMGDPYESMNQNPVDTYQAPEIVEPTIPEPETQPIYEPEEDDFNMPAAVPAVNTQSESANNSATAPKMGQNGSKAFDEILRDVSEYYKEERSKALTDAYNAGLNGLDITQEIRADAAVGGYLEQIEALYNAGQADARARTDTAATSSANSNQTGVDNPENLGYTAGNTTGYTGVDTVEPVKYTDTATNYGTSNTNGSASNSTSSDKSYEISDSEKELNYMMDMLFMNGAASSAIPSVQEAYQWLMNPNKNMLGKDFYEKLNQVKETFYAFMGGISDHQIAKSNHSAVGKDDELGLVDEIYAYKSSKTNAKPKPVAPVSTGDSEKTTGTAKQQDKPESYNWGQAGRTALGDIIKPNPELLTVIGGFLHEAYQAGLNGLDLSEELAANARAGGFLGEIETMYKAGETDAKIAGEVPKMGDDSGAQGEEEHYGSSNSKSGKDTASGENTTERYIITPWEKDFDYIHDMMYLNGAASSSNPSVQTTYQYFTDSSNKGKAIPQEIIETFQSFIENVDRDQRIRSHGIVTGVALEDDYAYQMVQILTRNRFNNNDYGLEDKDIITTGPYKGWTVNQGFDDQQTKRKGHLGYDLGGSGNSEIYPILSGEIVAMHWDKENPDDTANGISIVIKHTTPDGRIFYSSYSHLSEIDPDIYSGKITTVGTDTKIGTRGGTGASNQGVSHLHLAVFTTEKMDEIYNPIGYTIDTDGILENYRPFEKSKGCEFNYYYCMAQRDRSKVFYDPFIVMQTYGAIIDLFPIIR